MRKYISFVIIILGISIYTEAENFKKINSKVQKRDKELRNLVKIWGHHIMALT